MFMMLARFGAVAASLSLTMSTGIAEEALFGQNQPLYDGKHSWSLEKSEGTVTLAIAREGSSDAVLTHDVTDCAFCSGVDDNCDQDGVFPIFRDEDHVSAALGLICHVGAHSQRLMIFSPNDDPSGPVVDLTGAYFAQSIPFRFGIMSLHDAADGTEIPTYWPQSAEDARKQGDGFSGLVLPRPTVTDDDAAALHDLLTGIVQTRDHTALIALLNDDVASSFGGENGKSAFLQYWQLDQDPAESNLWDELGHVLSYGADLDASDGTLSLTYPYHFAQWPEDNALWDVRFVPFETATLRAGPARTAPIVQHLRFETIRPVENGASPAYEADGWHFVETADGIYGFIHEREAPHLLSYRLGLSNAGDAWKITYFIAGD